MMDQQQAIAAVDLGYAEFYRVMVRRGARGGIVIDKDGMMLVAGASTIVRAAMRTDERLPGREFLARIETFFRDRGMDHNIITRLPFDEDISELLAEAGCEPEYVESAMWLQRKPDPAKKLKDAGIREVKDTAGASDFGRAASLAFGESGIADGVVTSGRSVIAPHIRAFVGYLDDEPVATAMVLLHAGAAGVFWAGTVEEARHHGFGEAMVRTAASAGFDMGARFVWIGATRLGMPIYHKVGFTELGVDYLEYRFPVPNGR